MSLNLYLKVVRQATTATLKVRKIEKYYHLNVNAVYNNFVHNKAQKSKSNIKRIINQQN